MVSDRAKAIGGGCVCGVLGCGIGLFGGAWIVGEVGGDLEYAVAASIAAAILGGALGAVVGALFFGTPGGRSSGENKL